MNQFVWDMYYPDPVKVEGMIFWGDINRGPKAGPGKYFITIKANADSVEKEFTIKANPVYKCSDADYKLKTIFLVKVIDKYNEVQKTILKIRDYRNQISAFTGKLGKDCPKEIKLASDSINKQITQIEEALYQTKLKSGQDILNFPMQLNNKISSLYNYVDDSETAPNKQAQDAYFELEKLADVQLTKFKNVVDTDISNLNQIITAKALPLIILKKEEN